MKLTREYLKLVTLPYGLAVMVWVLLVFLGSGYDWALIGAAVGSLTFSAWGWKMIFIDAAKGQYERYLDAIEARLADGAVIAADNVLFRGYVMDEQCEVPRRFRTIVNRLRQFLAMLDENPRYEVVVYPEGDGIAICKYKKI